MKDKIIEEMARAICPNSNEWTCKACNWGAKPNCESYKNAEKLINAGYRKIPENSVVLSREEFEKYQRIENIIKRFSTISPTEAESENKALKETIAIVLAQKRNIWKRYNEKCEELKEASKETAERDFNHIIKALEIKKASIITHYGVKESVGADVAIRTVKELAKQFGVEIKE